MNRYMNVIPVLLVEMMLASCDDSPSPPPSPRFAPPADASTAPSPSPAVGAASEPQSSDSGSSGADANGAKTDKQPSGDPNGALTKEEERTAMPKPGQANDHSSPAFESAPRTTARETLSAPASSTP